MIISKNDNRNLLLITLDFIYLKINNRTVPNKKVRLGKIPKIDNGTIIWTPRVG